MYTYEKYLKTNEDISVREDAYALLEFMIFIDKCGDDSINEAAVEKVASLIKKSGGILDKYINPVANKAGINVSVKKGLVHYLASAGINTAKLIYHAINYYYNKDEKSKERIKEIIKSVKKEDLIDFLLKLDTLTLHLITGPIHTIDALTGTHIWANIKTKAETMMDKAKKAITYLESLKSDVEGRLKKQIQKYADSLKKIFGINSAKAVTESTVTADVENPDVKIGSAVKKCLKTKCKCNKKKRGSGNECECGC